MALIIKERKDRYYELVQEESNKIYSSWGNKRITSKQLVAKANEYAFDERLKKDPNFRFYVFAFLIALENRINKRYGTFFRKLLHIFAYLREKSALKTLKRVFGFNVFDDVKEMLEIEIERIIVILSQQQNKNTPHGGKRSEKEMLFEEKLNSFFKECLVEDEQKEVNNNLEIDKEKEKEIDANNKSFTAKTETAQREKISVQEFEKSEQVGQKRKEPNFSQQKEQTKKENEKTTKTEVLEKAKVEKPTLKTVATSSILAEKMVLEQTKDTKETSPFPVFRDNSNAKIDINVKNDVAFNKEITQTNTERPRTENNDKDIHSEKDLPKSPFPIFRGEKGGMGQSLGDTKVDIGEKTNPFLATVSEENKARIALNVTMRKEEIDAIVEQLNVAANAEMERVENEWREQISVENSGNDIKSNVKEIPNTSNNKNVVPGPKK